MSPNAEGASPNRTSPSTTSEPTHSNTARHLQTEWETDLAYEAGRLAGLAEYDREVVAALKHALGGSSAISRGEAVRRHQRALDQKARREAFDRGDPDVLAEAAPWARESSLRDAA